MFGSVYKSVYEASLAEEIAENEARANRLKCDLRVEICQTEQRLGSLIKRLERRLDEYCGVTSTKRDKESLKSLYAIMTTEYGWSTHGAMTSALNRAINKL